MYETYFFVSSGFYSATVNLQPSYTLTVYIPASSSLLHELLLYCSRDCQLGTAQNCLMRNCKLSTNLLINNRNSHFTILRTAAYQKAWRKVNRVYILTNGDVLSHYSLSDVFYTFGANRRFDYQYPLTSSKCSVRHNWLFCLYVAQSYPLQYITENHFTLYHLY